MCILREQRSIPTGIGKKGWRIVECMELFSDMCSHGGVENNGMKRKCIT